MIEFLVNGAEKITFSPKWIYCLANSGHTRNDREAHMRELCRNGIPWDEEIRLGSFENENRCN